MVYNNDFKSPYPGTPIGKAFKAIRRSLLRQPWISGNIVKVGRV